MRLARLWRDHSLTVTLAALGSILLGASLLLPGANWWDVLSGLALALLAGALVNGLAGPLHERNRPEE